MHGYHRLVQVERLKVLLVWMQMILIIKHSLRGCGCTNNLTHSQADGKKNPVGTFFSILPARINGLLQYERAFPLWDVQLKLVAPLELPVLV